MPQLPNRDDAEKRLAEVIQRVQLRTREKLVRALGNPPDARNIPESLWLEVERELSRETEALMVLFLIASGGTFTSWLDEHHEYPAARDALYQPEHFADIAARVGRAQSQRLAQQMTATSKQRLADVGQKLNRVTTYSEALRNELESAGRMTPEVREAIKERVSTERGTTARELYDRTVESITSESRAEIAARTEVTQSTTLGEVLVERRWKDRTPNLVTIKYWRHRWPHRPGHPCEHCRVLVDTPQNYWVALLPDDPQAWDGPPLHVNCFPAGTLVTGPGEFTGGTKAFYRGRVVEMVFGDGGVLTCTENHPILTPHGFVPANLLREGNNVLRALGVQRPAHGIDPDDHDVPTPIEEVFGALVKRRSMFPHSVPAAAEDLYGDGRFIDGEINVVNASGLLRNDADAHCVEDSGQRQFGRLHANDRIGLHCRRASLAFGDGHFPLSRRDMGGSNLSSLGFRRHSAPVVSPGLAAIARGNPSPQQLVANGRAGDVEHFGERVFGFARHVPLNQFVRDFFMRTPRFRATAMLRRRYDLDSIPVEQTPNRHLVDAKRCRDFIDRFAGRIATNKIIKIQSRDFSGHVYDLSCQPHGIFFANGIAVSNCDCWTDYQIVTLAQAQRVPTMFPAGGKAASLTSKLLAASGQYLSTTSLPRHWPGAAFKKTSDCGANAEGGGGFQSGNTCAAGVAGDGGSESRGGSLERTKSLAFRRWFGDSKIVDENGQPLVVYHGTRASFDVFNPAGSEYGIYLTTRKGYAERYAQGGDVMELYASISNPLIVEGKYEISPRDISAGDIQKLESQGYDGIVVVNYRDAENRADPDPIYKAVEIVAFRPAQVKSATDNVGDFSPDNPSIRKTSGCGANAAGGGGFQPGNTCAAGGGAQQTNTPEFQRWFGDSKVVDEHGAPLVVYHGTHRNFSVFNRLQEEKHRNGMKLDTVGLWFTSDEESAGNYGSIAMPAYLSIRHPLVFNGDGNQGGAKAFRAAVEREGGVEKFRAAAMADGHDGVAITGDNIDHFPGDVYIAFHPEQIKHAVDNAGTFDPADPDIRKTTASA